MAVKQTKHVEHMASAVGRQQGSYKYHMLTPLSRDYKKYVLAVALQFLFSIGHW